jgi:hypothetical protein
LDNDESGRSPQKEVIQYTVSIKLQGNSAAKEEVSPVEQKSRLVDITLTDYSNDKNDFSEEKIEESIPIPVFHFPERKPDDNVVPPLKRPNSIPIVSHLEPDEMTWRQIPIAKVDKSPTFEIPTVCFPQQRTFSPDVATEEGQTTLEIEEMNISEGSSSHSDRQGIESNIDNDVKAKVEVTKCKSFVEFEELSDESSEEDVGADEDVEGDESESESEPDPDQDQEGLDSEHSSHASRGHQDFSGSDNEGGYEEKRAKEKSSEQDEEDEDESFATCSSDLSSNKNERQMNNSSSKRSTSGHRSRQSRTRSPPSQQQQQPQQQQQGVGETEAQQIVIQENKSETDVWDSNDMKTEVEVSDIEEEEEELSNIPDIKAMQENRDFKLIQNGESPSIVSRYLSRLEREISETESEDESFEAFRTMRMRTGWLKSSINLTITYK